jgi:Zn-dependent M28 family amino/carboxypeptidase
MQRAGGATRWLVVGVLALSALVAWAADERPSIGPEQVAAHIAFLSDDLLEGRGIGVRGGHLAELYVATVYRLLGLSPAFADGYRQEIELLEVSPDPSQRIRIEADGEAMDLRWGPEVVTVLPRPDVHEISGELVFVGYGIDSPEDGWDDYGDVDVTGKVLIGFVNEPGRDQRQLFDGDALTYFGRWTYKLEEAARRGAAGMLLIHNRADAGYPYAVVRSSRASAAYVDPDAPPRMPVEGWIRESAVRRVLERTAHDLDALREAAEQPGFEPIPLQATVHVAAECSYRPIHTANVVGVIPGSGESDEAVVLSAHHDHFGIGVEVDGDAIYNGAIDNGSALAAMLVVAQAAAQRGGWEHDLIFLACAAEEKGLVGSSYFARNPPVPAAQLVANINFEMTSVWGRAKDLIAIGGSRSELGDVIAEVAERHGLEMAPEPAPEQGYLFRSDQLSFARVGVPAVWIDVGETLVEGPEGLGSRLRETYREHHYHRPSDELDPSWELTGTVQLAEIVLEVLEELDQRDAPLRWHEHSEFQRARD